MNALYAKGMLQVRRPHGTIVLLVCAGVVHDDDSHSMRCIGPSRGRAVACADLAFNGAMLTACDSPFVHQTQHAVFRYCPQ